MKTLLIQFVAVAAVLATQTDAQAQVPGRVARVQPLHSVQSDYSLGLRPHHYMPYHFGPWYHHASTAAEGYHRGIAARTYAQGAYNRLTAEARVIDAEARRREIENREMAAETYFAMREANRQARAAERGPRPTAEDLARYAEQAKPERLSPGELGMATGEVSWPVLLQAEGFAALRADLETAFATRAAHGKIGAEHQLMVEQATKAMLTELKKHVRQANPMDYTMARRFIESLAYEAKSPTS